MDLQSPIKAVTINQSINTQRQILTIYDILDFECCVLVGGTVFAALFVLSGLFYYDSLSNVGGMGFIPERLLMMMMI